MLSGVIVSSVFTVSGFLVIGDKHLTDVLLKNVGN